jgi:hypothetical protein
MVNSHLRQARGANSVIFPEIRIICGWMVTGRETVLKRQQRERIAPFALSD